MQVIVNGGIQAVPEGSTLAELVGQLRLGGSRIAVERNGDIIPRSSWAETPLAEGDRLEVVHAIGGG